MQSINWHLANCKIRLHFPHFEISNGTYTTDIENTIQHMLQHFTPEDDPYSDSEHHRQIRQLVMKPMDTTDDIELTQEEIFTALHKFDPHKAPGEDGLTSEILLKTLKFFPEIYNQCLKKGCFPKQWKRSSIIPIIKLGKEESSDESKYQPISFLNKSGKLLEKLLIDRIQHHLYSNSLMNNNQYGFIPQKSTVDAALAAKNFAEKHLQNKKYIVFKSLAVKGAFDAAWWPSILSNLRDLHCPRNLYCLA